MYLRLFISTALLKRINDFVTANREPYDDLYGSKYYAPSKSPETIRPRFLSFGRRARELARTATRSVRRSKTKNQRRPTQSSLLFRRHSPPPRTDDDYRKFVTRPDARRVIDRQLRTGLAYCAVRDRGGGEGPENGSSPGGH